MLDLDKCITNLLRRGELRCHADFLLKVHDLLPAAVLFNIKLIVTYLELYKYIRGS